MLLDIGAIPYENYFNRQYRVLWHQTLDEHIRYTELPQKTYNFDSYPVIQPSVYKQRTATNVGLMRFDSYLEDANIFEIWEADELSMRMGFFYEIKRMVDRALNDGEFLVWYPKDKTDIAFIIEPVGIVVGSYDRMDANPIHDRARRDFGWSKELIEFNFIVRRNYFPPNFSLEVEDI